MPLFNQSSQVALEALIVLAKKGKGQEGYLTVSEIAPLIPGGSPAYLSKVLSTLTKAGILRSQRGSFGGVLLAEPPERITLFQVIQAIEGRFVARLFLERPPTKTSPFLRVIEEMHGALTAQLNRWTLADLVRMDDDPNRDAILEEEWLKDFETGS